MRPELAGPGAAAPRVEHRHRRLVAEHSWRGLDRPQLKLIEALEPPGGTLHPAGERGAVEMDALPARICTCRYSGRYQANFETTTWLTSAVEAIPLSIRRGSTFAWTTPSVQPRQAYLGRIVRNTRRIAGITSSTSLTSSPILCSRPWQQGHAVVSGSSTCSQRGKCLGSAPMLRLAFLRGWPGGFAAGASSLAGTGGVALVSRSPNSSASCSATSAASRSERFPKIMSFSVCIATRSFSFSASSASTILVRAAVSVGRASGRIAMPKHTCAHHLLQKNPRASSDESRLSHRFGRDPHPIKCVEQHRKLCCTQMHHSVADRRPPAAPLLQPPRHQHPTAAVPRQALHSAHAFGAEHKHVAAVRVGLQRLAHHCRQRVHRLAQVDRLHRHHELQVS